jgi:hypothetical protein
MVPPAFQFVMVGGVAEWSRIRKRIIGHRQPQTNGCFLSPPLSQRNLYCNGIAPGDIKTPTYQKLLQYFPGPLPGLFSEIYYTICQTGESIIQPGPSQIPSTERNWLRPLPQCIPELGCRHSMWWSFSLRCLLALCTEPEYHA